MINLAKKYKQLFEGKTRSNDSKLLKEFQYEMDWEDVIDMDALDMEALVSAEDGAEVQIPTSQGEVGGGFRKDTEVAGEGLPEFLTAIIDKSEIDYYTFEFDKASAAALDTVLGKGQAEQVAAELEGWTEGELENYKPTGSGSFKPKSFLKAYPEFKNAILDIIKATQQYQGTWGKNQKEEIFDFIRGSGQKLYQLPDSVPGAKEMKALFKSANGTPEDQYKAAFDVLDALGELE